MPEQLRIELRPSRLLLGAILVIHGVALYCPWLSSLGTGYILALNLFVLASAALQLRRSSPGHPNAVTRIEYAAGRWRLQGPRGARQARLEGSAFVTPFLTVLRLRVAGERRSRALLLLPDSATPQERRRLRMLLISGGGR